MASQVRLVEEVTEEQQVAEVHERCPAHVVQARVAVAALHPAVHQATDHHAHCHLNDLGTGDEHRQWAGHPQASCPRRIVAVHEGVHSVVHSHEPATACHHVLVGVPRVEQHRDVVVPVQEEQLLLAQHHKSCVACIGRQRAGGVSRAWIAG